mgnify:CR=1 FL=1
MSAVSPQTASKASNNHVCPWWLAYTFDNPIRRLLHPAAKLLKDYVYEGMSVLDIGCGFGHFSIGMARLVKDTGSVTALDIQEKMLEKTRVRAEKQGVGHRIQTRLARTSETDFQGPYDFVLASNVLHEMPDPAGAAHAVAASLKPEHLLYAMEPAGHVNENTFETELDEFKKAGFTEVARPRVIKERCAILRAPSGS